MIIMIIIIIIIIVIIIIIIIIIMSRFMKEYELVTHSLRPLFGYLSFKKKRGLRLLHKSH